MWVEEHERHSWITMQADMQWITTTVLPVIKKIIASQINTFGMQTQHTLHVHHVWYPRGEKAKLHENVPQWTGACSNEI